MKVTLITATYNSAKNLRDCLQSVAEQTYPNIEHIVIDGGSSDGTMDLVKSFPSVTKFISEPDKGIYDALNKGIQLATGDVIGFAHSDDMLAEKDIISRIVNSFSPSKGEISEGQRGSSSPKENNASGADHPLPTASQRYSPSERGRNSFSNGNIASRVDGIFGNLVFVDPENTDKIVRTWISTPFNRSEVKHGWMPPHPTLFLRREVYEKHGTFDTSFKIAGDYDFMLRVMLDETINLRLLPEIIVKMRKGGASTGSFSELLHKKSEDLRAMKNNGFVFPLWVLLMKNVRKIPQLLLK